MGMELREEEAVKPLKMGITTSERKSAKTFPNSMLYFQAAIKKSGWPMHSLRDVHLHTILVISP